MAMCSWNVTCSNVPYCTERHFLQFNRTARLCLSGQVVNYTSSNKPDEFILRVHFYTLFKNTSTNIYRIIKRQNHRSNSENS